MMRSLFSGVSGLQNHQTRMDVLGNNISNVNTVGFKKGRVTFQDMLSQTLAGAARPTDDLGGVNPKQIGLGMTIASIDTLHTQGSLQTTGNMTDIALQGEGMFVLSEGEQLFYSRAGAFGLDADGILVNPANGMRVQGWQAQRVDGQDIINSSAAIGDLQIPIGAKDPAQATTEVFMASNLDKRLPEIPPGASALDTQRGTWTTTFDVFDSFGNTHTLQVNFKKVVGLPNQWNAEVVVDPASIVPTNTLVDVGPGGNTGNTFTVNFDNLGALQAITDAQGDTQAAGNLQVQVAFDVADAEGGGARQTFNLNLGEVGAYRDAITQFAESSSTKIVRQNGNGMGFLDSFRIDQSGVITGVFSNGANRPLGQLALAMFANAAGMEKAGDTTFVVTNNSGDANIGPSGQAGRGSVIAGTLEMSNVDLAEQFTDMIVTQRGFQANSRTITTSDQMLQELLSLKR